MKTKHNEPVANLQGKAIDEPLDIQETIEPTSTLATFNALRNGKAPIVPEYMTIENIKAAIRAYGLDSYATPETREDLLVRAVVIVSRLCAITEPQLRSILARRRIDNSLKGVCDEPLGAYMLSKLSVKCGALKQNIRFNRGDKKTIGYSFIENLMNAPLE